MIMVEYDRSNNVNRPVGHYAPHGSPHLPQHLDQRSAHSTPSPTFPNAQLPHLGYSQPPTVRSTPTSYPSPASYPSPSMSAYQYPPQQQPPSRGSPHSQPASINLPPIRLNPPPTQLQPQYEGSPLLGSSLPPHPGGYYPVHPLPPPAAHHITSQPIHGSIRYALPPAERDGRVMSGGRHKKEIKRRTKTGCLTCRKRRIKCDEGHPTCKNCTKSKRDCLGYDPIFKAQPGPPAIQPAPQQGPAQPMSAGSPGMYGMSGTTMAPAYVSNISTNGSSPGSSSCDTYEYHPQIDPTLDATTSHPAAIGVANLLEAQTTYRPELKRTLDRTSPFSSASEPGRPIYPPIPRSDVPAMTAQQPQQQSDARDDGRAKRIKIDDLLSVGSLTAPPLSPPTSELATSVSEKLSPAEVMKNTYKGRYAGALDNFLEVEWFKSTGANKLCTDLQLQEKMTEVFERLRARGGSYVEEEDPIIVKAGAEADLLWAAVQMTYGTRIPSADTRKDGRDSEERALEGPLNGALDQEGVEALRRINIVESLLVPLDRSGANLSRKSEQPPPTGNDRNDGFWDLLEDIKDFRTPPADAESSEPSVNDLLSKAEQLVGERPNRKLLLSLAELQHTDPANRLLTHLRAAIEATAKDANAFSVDSLERRIAGRALAMWKDPITDFPCCMTPSS